MLVVAGMEEIVISILRCARRIRRTGDLGITTGMALGYPTSDIRMVIRPQL